MKLARKQRSSPDARSQTLQAALSTLSATQREALLARALGDNYDQIASSLHTSTSNARKLVQLARKHLNPL